MNILSRFQAEFFSFSDLFVKMNDTLNNDLLIEVMYASIDRLVLFMLSIVFSIHVRFSSLFFNFLSFG